jgi:ATP/maltotriose-dependent transcriptional regulator MalT
LSKRESEVANLMAASRTREGIHQALVIELSSVDTHISKVWQKLGIEDVEKTMRKEVLLAKAFNLIQLRRK